MMLKVDAQMQRRQAQFDRRQLAFEARQAKIERDQARNTRDIAAINKIVRLGMRLIVRIEKAQVQDRKDFHYRINALIAGHEELRKLVTAVLRRGVNGRRRG